MDEQVMGRILEELDAQQSIESDEKLCFCETDCTPADFSQDNFHALSPKIDSGSNISFIDGGNTEIFSSPDTCVHFIRIFHTVYRDNKRISCSADEFFVLCQTRMKEDSIVFSAKLFKSIINSLTDSFFTEKFTFNPLDSNLTARNSRMTLETVPGILRRIAELSTALILASKADKGDIIMIDGDLQTKTTDEKKLINAMAGIAKDKNISIAALSKTSNLLTSTGRSVAHALSSIAPSGSWHYSPAAKRQDTIISFAKLNPKSDYIFKFESFNQDNQQDMLSLLSANSTDAVFLGYPYGLIEADRFARVPNRERDMLRTMFMAKSGKDWQQLDSRSKALDAHSMLDSI